jgi:hypothetical protein
MVNNEVKTVEPRSELSPWYSFLAGLSARTGISQNPLLCIGLVAGAFAAFLAGEGFDSIGWDSAGLLLRVITMVAAVGSVVVLLPSVGRRIVISLLILFHFGGILAAVTCIDPAPWISQQLWTVVYRPYVHFLYMNNAYHFYSPEPGPASLMWFCIEYEQDPDGTRNFRWVLMPDLRADGHDYDPDETRVWSGTEYTRRLSLAENAGHPAQPPWYWQQLLQRRLQAGGIQDIPDISPMEIPYPNQYREPNTVAKRWIQTYVRHVAHTYKHQDKPDLRVTGVKFYQVIHQFLLPNQLATGIQPDDNRTYRPYYCGDFDPDGNIKETCFLLDDQDPQASYRDPFLYWLIPIDSLIKHAEGRSGMIPWGHPDKGEDE